MFGKLLSSWRALVLVLGLMIFLPLAGAQACGHGGCRGASAHRTASVGPMRAHAVRCGGMCHRHHGRHHLKHVVKHMMFRRHAR